MSQTTLLNPLVPSSGLCDLLDIDFGPPSVSYVLFGSKTDEEEVRNLPPPLEPQRASALVAFATPPGPASVNQPREERAEGSYELDDEALGKLLGEVLEEAEFVDFVKRVAAVMEHAR